MSSGIIPLRLPLLTRMTIPKTTKIIPRIRVIKLWGFIFLLQNVFYFIDIAEYSTVCGGDEGESF
jgi:hypothetical protein